MQYFYITNLFYIFQLIKCFVFIYKLPMKMGKTYFFFQAK